MKALSIRAPWWWFILHGKPVENRDWYTGFRGPCLLHASKWFVLSDFLDDWDCAARMYEQQTGTAFPHEPPAETINEIKRFGGHIVGQMRIAGCVKHHPSPFFVGEWGFVLEDAKQIAKPFPFRGALGFFDVPANLMPPDPAQLAAAGQASLFQEGR